jgi:hypothetical protein
LSELFSIHGNIIGKKLSDRLVRWLDPDSDWSYRTSQSTPLCQRIHRVLQRWFLTWRFLPKSSMGKALSYALGQWESLEVYLKEPAIEIDTNLVENAIRPTALGKKN